MAYNYEYPYTDAQRGNSDWIIKEIKTLREEYETFVVMNEVQYAEPLQWSIDRQYTKNTIVQDNDGEATYLSKQPVPAGIQITNEDYWMKLADYAPDFTKLRTQIFPDDFGSVSVAPQDVQVDDIFWLHGYLCQATQVVYTGYPLVEGVNYIHITVSQLLSALDTLVNSFSGAISDLQNDMTTAQSDITTLYGQVGALQTKSTVLVKNVTLYAADWSGAIYTITDSDITATAIVVLATPAGLSPTQLSELQDANIVPYGQSAGSIQIAAAGNVPTVDIAVQMLIYLN